MKTTRLFATFFITIVLLLPIHSSFSEEDDYGWNMMTVQERIEHRKIMSAFKKNEEIESYRTEHHKRLKEQAKKKAIISEFVGTIGKRQDFTLTVKKALAFESQYGTIYFYIMEDSKENTFVWKTTKGLEADTKYILKGKIKEHEIYRDRKQTIITRCKIIRKMEVVA